MGFLENRDDVHMQDTRAKPLQGLSALHIISFYGNFESKIVLTLRVETFDRKKELQADRYLMELA